LLLGEQDKPALDLKKSGIFPIVHGVRSLALSEHVPATGTQARIDALVAGGRLSSAFGTDLGDSLHFLMGLKLKAGLAELDTGGTVSGGVRSDRLSSLERDLLKDALAVVKRFKAIVRNRFRLEAE
jgi:CBS domain-containing protein